MKAVVEWPCCREARIFDMNGILRNQAIFNYRARREYGERPTHLSGTFTEKEVKGRFRFNRESIYFIADLIREDLQRPTRRNHAMTVEEEQACIALRFVDSGYFQQVIGDISGRAKSTVSRVIKSFCEAIVRGSGEFVSFPNNQQKQKNKEKFFEMGEFPSVIACVDGFHVGMEAPSERERDFVNRKGCTRYDRCVIQMYRCCGKVAWINPWLVYLSVFWCKRLPRPHWN